MRGQLSEKCMHISDTKVANLKEEFAAALPETIPLARRLYPRSELIISEKSQSIGGWRNTGK